VSVANQYEVGRYAVTLDFALDQLQRFGYLMFDKFRPFRSCDANEASVYNLIQWLMEISNGSSAYAIATLLAKLRTETAANSFA